VLAGETTARKTAAGWRIGDGRDPKLAPINARAETLATSPLFREAFPRHRWLVVADGFLRVKEGRAHEDPALYPPWIRTALWVHRYLVD
jgi:putative SOS response-associated peptidase YedK